MSRKLYLRTFGCQMNSYDSERMADLLAETEGAELTDDPNEADIVLFNTCSIREKAQEKVFSDLGYFRAMKAARPELIIGVGGCVASQEGEAIVARAPFVDVVFGPQTLHRLPELIDRRRQTGHSQVDIRFPEIEKFDALPPPRKVGASAFVSIMEGCSKYCSFCVVPYTRGEEISRPFEDVLSDVITLAEQGVKEVTLLGQNVNAYLGQVEGFDAPADFATLLDYIHDIPGIERIRYTTSHPREFTERLIDAHARLPKLAPLVHLPVQSGSDRILAAMKRGYTALEYRSIVRRLRAASPGIGLTTDFIVGFPGETEADFLKTLKLAEDLAYDDAYSFIYSPRPAGRHPARGEGGAAAAPSGRGPAKFAGHCPRHGGLAPARAGRRPVAQGCQRAVGPLPQQPHGQFPRFPQPHRSDDRRGHHRRHEPHAAW